MDGQTQPFNTPYIAVRYQLPSVGYELAHDVSRYTNAPRSSTVRQFGYYDGPDEPAVQVDCYDIGVMMNSWSANNLRGWHGDYNTVYSYGFTPMPESPFNATGTSSLVVQAHFAVPTYMAYPNKGVDPIGGLGFAIFLYDTKSQMGFGLDGQVFDNRTFTQMYGSSGHFCGMANIPYCASALNRDEWYTTPDINSATWTSQIWSEKRFYRMTVSPANMINMAKELNLLLDKTGESRRYSLTPTDYRLSEVTVLAETEDCPNIHSDCGSRVSMGWSLSSLGVFRKVDTPPPPVCTP